MRPIKPGKETTEYSLSLVTVCLAGLFAVVALLAAFYALAERSLAAAGVSCGFALSTAHLIAHAVGSYTYSRAAVKSAATAPDHIIRPRGGI